MSPVRACSPIHLVRRRIRGADPGSGRGSGRGRGSGLGRGADPGLGSGLGVVVGAVAVLVLGGCSGGDGAPTAAGGGGTSTSSGPGASDGRGMPTAGAPTDPPGTPGSTPARPSSPVPLPTEPGGCVEIGSATVVNAGTPEHPLPAAVLGGGVRAVVMVNDRGQGLCGWLPFARALTRAGLRVLLYDQPATDPPGALRGATSWLREHGNGDVGYVGAGTGATTATAVAAALTPRPYAVVVLSPTASAVRVPGLYAAAATGDTAASTAARRLTASGGRLRLVPGRARGAALVTGATAGPVVADIATFLRQS